MAELDPCIKHRQRSHVVMKVVGHGHQCGQRVLYVRREGLARLGRVDAQRLSCRRLLIQHRCTWRSSSVNFGIKSIVASWMCDPDGVCMKPK